MDVSLCLLCDSIEFLLAAVAERITTNPGSPAPSPGPSPASGPAQRLLLLLLLPGWQQEHHAAGHQDVPQRVYVVVVVLRLSKHVQTHTD